MTTKEKYELIDKTKINEKVLAILQNMEKSSSNFTDEAVNSKIDGALDKLIEGFRANKPEALRTLPEAKKEVKKEKEKATKENEGKDLSDKKDTDDKTGLPKKDTLEERKDIIKKQSESEKEARDRARKELEKEKEKAKDEVESQIEKLNRIILEDPSLRGFNTGTAATGGGKSTPIIDAERKALPRGSRVSQKGWKNQYGASDGGRKYWENRENRSDRKSPEYETGKPYLAKGGNVYSSDDMYEITMVQDGIELDSKLIRARNKAEARMIFQDMYLDKYQDEFGEFEIKIEVAKNKMSHGGYMTHGGMMDEYGGYKVTFQDNTEEKLTWSEYVYANSKPQAVVRAIDSLSRKYPTYHDFSKMEVIEIEEGEKYAKGGEMADGGGVPYKPYGKTKGRFKLTYEVEGEPQSEIRQSLEEATDSARRYINPKLGYTNVHIYDESGKEYFFGDGGETDNSLPDRMAGFFPINLLKDAYVIKEIKYYKDKSLFTDDYTVRDFKNDFPKEYHNVTLDEAYKLIDELNNTKMADGGEVDFQEKMAKMRSAYENLEMQVKGKIASAVGIDEAIRIMENDYEIHPFDFITRAVRSGLLGIDEINRDLVFSALIEAENITEEYRDSGQGIGSSDMTYFTKHVLDYAGFKTGFLNNRLTRVDADGNELVIDKYEMNY